MLQALITQLLKRNDKLNQNYQESANKWLKIFISEFIKECVFKCLKFKICFFQYKTLLFGSLKTTLCFYFYKSKIRAFH